MMALKEHDNTARKVEVLLAITNMLGVYYKRGAVDDVTLIISHAGKPVKTMTTLTAAECLDMLSEVADDAIKHGATE